MLSKFLSFCESVYGGTHELYNSQLGHRILRIWANGDCFIINLTDKHRFGKFDLTHRNNGRDLNGKYWFHQQLKAWDLSFAIYAAYSHGFNKQLGIMFEKEDYKRFMSDWKKIAIGGEYYDYQPLQETEQQCE